MRIMNVECGLQLRDCDICDSIVICNNNIFYRIHNVIFAKKRIAFECGENSREICGG